MVSLVPYSNGEYFQEFNQCHNPAGPAGGQFCSTGNPAFAAWFKGSKVVNADGSPKVLYHGTNANPEYFRPFTHFGTANAANERSETLRSFSVDVVKRTPGAFQVMPVYLSIKRPLRMPDLASIDDVTGEPLEDEELDDYSGGEPRGWENETSVATTLYEMDVISRDEFWDVQYDNTKAFRLLMRKGYDGIVYKNHVEDAGNDSYIIFKASQAKSAIGNRGTFDRRKARMTEFNKCHLPRGSEAGGQFCSAPDAGSGGGPASTSAQSVLRAAFPGVEIHLHDKSHSYAGRSVWYLDTMVVPEAQRRTGVGSAIMRRLTALADARGATVALTPSSDFGSSVSRLRAFYRRFGFHPNTGRHADNAVTGAMIRYPLKGYSQGYSHGVTGYGFQKRASGRKGSARYAAYRKGYDAGVDDSGG